MPRKGSSRRSRAKANLTVPVVVGVVVVILIAFVMNFHFVLTKNDFKIIKKSQWGFKDTLVDTRSWGPLDWIDHSDLLKAMVNNTLDDLQKDIVK